MSATALATGRFRGSRIALKIHFGSVSSAPERKFVTMISSNESANASSAPAMSAVRIAGSVTWRNVCQPSAPRSIDASTIDPDVRRSRAITLLNTTTTQNVAWPIMIVHIENVTPVVFIADRSAIAVMMPGQRDRQHEHERHGLPAEEPEPVHGERSERAEHDRDRSGDQPDLRPSSRAPRACSGRSTPARTTSS